MSAPHLSRAGPIPDANSFYNPEAISRATSVTGNPTSHTSKECVQGLDESAPVGGTFEIPINLNYVSENIGEDARVIQLYGKLSSYPDLNGVDSRELDQMFRKMAGDCYTSIATETVNFLPGITQGLLQFVKELQEKVGHLEIRQLQRNQDAFQAEDHMRGCIRWLQGENEMLQVKIVDLRAALSETEQNYTSMKAQKDSLKSALELEHEATSNPSNETASRKRRHGE